MQNIDELMKTAAQHHQAGQLDQAAQLYEQILQSDPNNAVALHLLGVIAHQRDRHNDALELVEKAIEVNPKIPRFYNTLGLVFEAMDKFDRAIKAYEQAVELAPDFAEALHNMAIALQGYGLYEAAIEKCEKAIAIKPDYAQAYNTMGYCFDTQGKDELAIENYEKAIQLKPDYAEAYNHLGTIHSAHGRFDEAIENYNRAIRIDPDYAEAHWNLAPSLLVTGNLADGWREYAWRRHPDLEMLVYPHQYDLPQWDGSFFQGKRLLIHYEQGLGDTINFLRYIPMVKARGGTVIFEVRKPLYNLLRDFAGIDELVEASPDSRPSVDFDLHVSLLDLPGIFNTTLETIPAQIPYIFANPAKLDYWRDKLTGPGLKVGIVWSGSPSYERNHLRACKLADFTSLSGIKGVKFYSIQKGEPANQVSQLAGKMPLTDLSEQLADFSDTAAVIGNLDLIISTDTSVPHLAGAMGKPTWLLLSCAHDWRWLLERDDSPWYPSMRLFRQKDSNQWYDVFENVRCELEKMLTGIRPQHCNSTSNISHSPRASVVIPSYKNPHQLEKCITHLKNQTVPVDIFIRDNNTDNVYFTAAINEGIKKYLNEPCDYILVLNQDMYLEPDALEAMIKFMDSYQKCGIGVPLQLSNDSPDYVINAGGLEAFPTGTHQHGRLSQFTKNEPLFWGNGACMMLRKQMVQEIGLMDKNYVLIGSDSDYCLTARSRGWEVWRIVAARGIHEGGITARIADTEFEILKMNDYIHFGEKWLTTDLYKQLACNADRYSADMINNFMTQFRAVKTELESKTSEKICT